MIDHLTLKVTDLQRSKQFYLALLQPLGYRLSFDNDFVASFATATSTDPGGDFWLSQGTPTYNHVAFNAANHAMVVAFHQAGIAAGGQDNGQPGLRPQYHAGYYAAYILDPDGYNIEAVCHDDMK